MRIYFECPNCDRLTKVKKKISALNICKQCGCSLFVLENDLLTIKSEDEKELAFVEERLASNDFIDSLTNKETNRLKLLMRLTFFHKDVLNHIKELLQLSEVSFNLFLQFNTILCGHSEAIDVVLLNGFPEHNPSNIDFIFNHLSNVSLSQINNFVSNIEIARWRCTQQNYDFSSEYSLSIFLIMLCEDKYLFTESLRKKSIQEQEYRKQQEQMQVLLEKNIKDLRERNGLKCTGICSLCNRDKCLNE